MATILLLALSNIFTPLAWSGHPKHLHDKPLWIAVPIAWDIAFFEYCLLVPANRIGSAHYTGYQLKSLQEVLTLVVSVVFALLVFGEKLRWSYAVSPLFILLAVVFAFAFDKPAAPAA